MVNKERMVNLFLDLARIESTPGREKRMVARLKKEISALDYEIIEDDAGKNFGGNAGNLIVDIPGKSGVPRLLLSAHLDHIGCERVITPHIKGGVIVSGGIDDLAGVVVILESLYLRKKYFPDYPGMKVVFTVGEEAGLQGARFLDNKYLTDIDYGLVYDGEGEMGTVVYRAPAQARLEALIRGEHRNKIKCATAVLSAVERIKENENILAGIRFTGSCKGKFSLKLTGEVRGFKNKTLARNLERIINIIRRKADYYNCRLNYSIDRLYGNFSLNPDSRLIKLLKRAGSECQIPVSFAGGTTGCDANIFNEKGIETAVLGMGLRDLHTAEEKININNMAGLVRLSLELFSGLKLDKDV